MKMGHAIVVHSTRKPEAMSIRSLDGGDPREAIKDFEDGDRVTIVKTQELMELMERVKTALE